MTREEQRIEQIEKFASQCYEDGEIYSAFISGAIWADDNPAQDVVNLNDLWHDASEEPQCEYEFICQDTLGNVWLTNRRANETGWEERAIRDCIARWAYVSDLLPKGGKRCATFGTKQPKSPTENGASTTSIVGTMYNDIPLTICEKNSNSTHH